MNDQISQITDEIAAISDRQAPLIAAMQRQSERKNANAADFAAKTDMRATASEPLTEALRAEALGVGTTDAVNAIRTAIAAADDALSAAKSKMDGESAEIDAVIASLQSEVEAFSAQAAPLHALLRETQIALLQADLKARTKAFDAQIAPMAALMARVLGAEKYLSEIGSASSIRNSNTNQFCLPAFNSDTVIAPIGAAIDAEASKLRDEWRIAPVQSLASGNPWGIDLMMR